MYFVMILMQFLHDLNKFRTNLIFEDQDVFLQMELSFAIGWR